MAIKKKKKKGSKGCVGPVLIRKRPLIGLTPFVEFVPHFVKEGRPWEQEPSLPFHAIKQRKNDYLAWCLESGWNIDYSPSGWHPFIEALFHDNYDAYLLLLEFGGTWDSLAWCRRGTFIKYLPSECLEYHEERVAHWTSCFSKGLPPIEFLLHKAILMEEDSLVEALLRHPDCYTGVDDKGLYPFDYVYIEKKPTRFAFMLVGYGVSEWTRTVSYSDFGLSTP